MALVELVEAAVHSGMTETAAGAYRRLTAMTGPAGTDWALGLAARSRALLSDGDEAEGNYREAIDRLGRTRLRAVALAHDRRPGEQSSGQRHELPAQVQRSSNA